MLSAFSKIERPLVIVSVSIALLAACILLLLITSSLIQLYDYSSDYYHTREADKKECLELFIDGNTYWKDETFMGFGPEGSYGCFLVSGEEKGEIR